MASAPPITTRLARLARRVGVLRTRDLEAAGVNRVTLGRLVAAGAIERVGRGLYAIPTGKVTEHHTLAEASVRVPAGIVCLLSAVQFHKLSTQSPHEVWIAIGVKARKPAADWPPLHVVRFSAAALIHGVETHKLEGVDVRITSPSADFAVQRVAARVAMGGHSIPEHVVRRRFERGRSLFDAVYKFEVSEWYQWFSDSKGLSLVATH